MRSKYVLNNGVRLITRVYSTPLHKLVPSIDYSNYSFAYGITAIVIDIQNAQRAKWTRAIMYTVCCG